MTAGLSPFRQTHNKYPPADGPVHWWFQEGRRNIQLSEVRSPFCSKAKNQLEPPGGFNWFAIFTDQRGRGLQAGSTKDTLICLFSERAN